MATAFDTHDVTNQPPPLTAYNVADSDRALMEALEREGAPWANRASRTHRGRRRRLRKPPGR